ncbi:hypothetical protein L3Q82_001400 [Scortum barcoo]|uniref:Uncharacterized protein n=1 Tax=Scortum barcoo TaxID=214431 RepID=A0ACB8W6Z0_9TELE|nr:hypothetical protein L3Q82_001400 [Scortum barcoo]
MWAPRGRLSIGHVAQYVLRRPSGTAKPVRGYVKRPASLVMMVAAVERRRRRQQRASWRPVGRAGWEGGQHELSEACQGWALSVLLSMMQFAAGLKEKLLADIFQVSVSTVHGYVVTGYGSLLVWKSSQQAKSHHPTKIQAVESRVLGDYFSRAADRLDYLGKLMAP